MALVIKALDLTGSKYQDVLMNDSNWPKSMAATLKGLKPNTISIEEIEKEVLRRAIMAETLMKFGGVFANFSNISLWESFLDKTGDNKTKLCNKRKVWENTAAALLIGLEESALGLGLSPEKAKNNSVLIAKKIGLSKGSKALYIPRLRELKAALESRHISQCLKTKKAWEIAEDLELSEQRIYGIINSNKQSKKG